MRWATGYGRLVTVHSAVLPPGPRPFDLANARRWSRNPIDAMVATADRYGDAVRLGFGLGSRRIVITLVRTPDAMQHVLVTNQNNYVKAPTYETLEALLGKGLLTNEGASWERQRRLIQPSFARRHVVGFADAMAEATADHLARWERGGSAPRRVDVAREMSALTLDIVGRTLFGTSLAHDAGAVGPALTTVLREAVQRIRHPLPRFIPGGERLLVRAQKRFTESAAVLDGVVRELMSRRPAAGGRETLLGLLLDTRDESGRPMEPTQIRDELMTFLLAGHETTANALAWTVYLLSLHPQARERLEDEVDAVLSGRVPSADDADKLVWCRAVIDESMRLYPPAWTFERQAVDDDELLGYLVPAGTVVMTPPYLVHHDARWWPNPEGFDPRRFLPGAEPQRHKFAYLPFGGGRRQCIGSGFATLEATIVLAMICQRWRLDAVPGVPVVPEPTVTLRPRDGLVMALSGR
jgi:cytochrome P450